MTLSEVKILQEINTKDGRKLVMLNVEELVRIAEDEGQIKDHKEDHHIQCPYCVDNYDRIKNEFGEDKPYFKLKLYIDKESLVGQCWRCHRVFIHYTEELTYSLNLPD